MKQSILMGLTALLLAVFLPAALLSPAEAAQPEPMVVTVEQPAAAPEEAPEEVPEEVSEEVPEEKAVQEASYDEETSISLLTGNDIQSLPLSGYLTGVVLSEMPASFQLEALKAQAVAARTFTLRHVAAGKHDTADLCADSSCCQAWASLDTLQDKLGDAFSQYWQKAAQAVEETDGMVLTYDGQLIDAVYFSCSGGATEDAVAVWGGDVAYLQSVESPGEEISSKFETEVTFTPAEFSRLLTAANPACDFSGSVQSWFGETVTTDGGGVGTMVIGGQVFEGTELRTLLHLNSAKFTVEADAEEIRFTVSGYGHRVGMSQYGAEAMARDGSTFEEILLHYYTGVTLTRMTATD